ncbi:hypothetical protein GOC29_19270, partial [Sinorhizobium meliloti]|nr:hypothetical protein [Sinorhizobium meliloti]MDX0132881.1 hypothetical protein [Sinorhizobium meliloti]
MAGSRSISTLSSPRIPSRPAASRLVVRDGCLNHHARKDSHVDQGPEIACKAQGTTRTAAEGQCRALCLRQDKAGVVQTADSDEAAPLFRDDCAPGFRDDLAPC